MAVWSFNEAPRVGADATIEEAMARMLEKESFVLQVTNGSGEPVGWLDSLDLLRAFMQDPDMTAVRKKSIREFVRAIAEEDYLEENAELSTICSWAEKRSQRVPYFTTREGKAGVLSTHSLLREALQGRERERKRREEAEARLERLGHVQQELEKALANLFADHGVVDKLKSIVEYQDEYDPATGKIKITGVIQEGVYRHVVNILRLLTELWEQGLMELAGMSQETLVKTAIFHDLGKVQPYLAVGEIVDPKGGLRTGQVSRLQERFAGQKSVQPAGKHCSPDQIPSPRRGGTNCRPNFLLAFCPCTGFSGCWTGFRRGSPGGAPGLT